MEKGSRTREVIEQMVRQEIEKIASEMKDVVREAVRANLLPQLKTTIRHFISEVVEETLSEELLPAKEFGISEKNSDLPSFEPFTPCHSEEAKRPKNLAQGEAEVAAGAEGRYVYCVADSGVAVSLGHIGIEDSEVYTIPYKSLCAVVHNCPIEPYKSDNQEIVKGWVQTHQKVLDVAVENFGTVLPLGFDTIIKTEHEADPKQVVKDWLKDDFENLKNKMDKVRGRQEFGVQIFYDPKVVGEIIAQGSKEIQKLKEEMATQKPGMAYMYKQKVERAVREEMEKRAEGYFRDFYGTIKNQVDDVKVEKVKRDKDKAMLMNLSCLVSREKVEVLGNELGRINNMDGFSVRFTGPWAPYSFV